MLAPAKVNLWLNVVGRRADGYHLLDSLVAFTDLADEIEASPSDRLSLSVEGPFAAMLAGEADNLVLEAAREHKGFFRYAMAVSQQHKQNLLAHPLEGETLQRFEISAADSLVLQKRIEENEQGSFEEYVAGYYA